MWRPRPLVYGERNAWERFDLRLELDAAFAGHVRESPMKMQADQHRPD
jgi:hypothetical protein